MRRRSTALAYGKGIEMKTNPILALIGISLGLSSEFGSALAETGRQLPAIGSSTFAQFVAGYFAETLVCPNFNISNRAILDDFVEQFEGAVARFATRPVRHRWETSQIQAPVVDLKPLTVTPLEPASIEREAHLPVECGLMPSTGSWVLENNVHFEPNGDLLTQGLNNLPKDHFLFRKSEGAQDLYKLVSAKAGERSIHENGAVGDQRFIPLGQGVYLHTYEDANRKVYYYGLVIAPSQTSFQRRACEKAAALKKYHDLLQPAESQATQSSIRQLFMRGEALARVQALTQQIRSLTSLPEATLMRLRGDAKQLLEVVEGRAELPGYIPAPARCPDGSILFK
jgi:hypothetical protein